MFRSGFIIVLFGGLAGCASQAAHEPPRTAASPKAAPEASWMGVATCASAACHNGGGKHGEYGTWAGPDKHARAFQVLTEPRAATILRNLHPDDDCRPATKEPQCLACHAGGAAAENRHGPRFQPSDGVGCESCHGPAGRYLTEHYRAGFASQSEDEKWERYGLLRTKNQAERAKVCARCHVGDAASGREVNHELYAAGHPRLDFEYAAYLAEYPKHWDAAAEKQRHADYEARVWLVGQAAWARASLELLRDRANRARNDPSSWPEFAEYACFACHKGLKAAGQRREVGFGHRVPGSLPWAAWPAARRLAAAGGARIDRETWDELGREMERPRPDPAKVQALAEALLTSPDGWRWLGQGPLLTPRAMRSLESQLLRMDGLDTPTWDEAVQLYRGLDALELALQDLEGQPRPAKFAAALQQLKRELATSFDQPGPKTSHPESPANFNPAKVRALLRKMRVNAD